MPSDNVRLLMDPNLEPGILSVEYGNGCEQFKSTSHDEVVYDNDSPQKPLEKSKAEELSYILTVDDDLYKRLIKEISDSVHLPCGLYYCCQESQSSRVSIGVAIFLLSIVFTFLVAVLWAERGQ